MEALRGRADHRWMDRRVLWICMVVGSTVGGLVPTLFGQGSFSAASLLGSAVGGIAGIWLATRIVI